MTRPGAGGYARLLREPLLHFLAMQMVVLPLNAARQKSASAPPGAVVRDTVACRPAGGPVRGGLAAAADRGGAGRAYRRLRAGGGLLPRGAGPRARPGRHGNPAAAAAEDGVPERSRRGALVPSEADAARLSSSSIQSDSPGRPGSRFGRCFLGGRSPAVAWRRSKEAASQTRSAGRCCRRRWRRRARRRSTAPSATGSLPRWRRCRPARGRGRWIGLRPAPGAAARRRAGGRPAVRGGPARGRGGLAAGGGGGAAGGAVPGAAGALRGGAARAGA